MADDGAWDDAIAFSLYVPAHFCNRVHLRRPSKIEEGLTNHLASKRVCLNRFTVPTTSRSNGMATTAQTFVFGFLQLSGIELNNDKMRDK